MTREEFEARYARQSNMTLEKLREHGGRGVPCDCGEPGCAGWAMTFPADRRRILTEGEIEDAFARRRRVNMDMPHETDLDRMFSYHAPKGDQAARYERINQAAKAFARVIVECCPASGDRTNALAIVRDARMWANASIACNE